MSCGKVRPATVDRSQTAAAADGRHEKGRSLGLSFVEIVEDSQAGIIATGAQKKSTLFASGFAFNNIRSALLDPPVDQLLRESPLPCYPSTGNLTGLGKEINFLLVNSQVTRHFPGVH